MRPLALAALLGVVAPVLAGCPKPDDPAPAALIAVRIISIAPVSGPDTGGTVITVNGDGFVAGATLTVGGVAATGLGVTQTQVTGTTPVGAAGPADVVVSNPGGSTVTAVAGFTYWSGSAPAPTITSLTPTFGTTAGGGLITLTGTGFQTGATITVGGTAATTVTVLTAGKITFVVPAGSAGPATVLLTNPDTQTATATGGFTYGTPVPTVTAVNPTSGPVAGGTLITVTGTAFRAAGTVGPSVAIGGVAASGVQVLTSTTLRCTTGAATIVGPQTVLVINADTQSGGLAGGFTYVGPSPTVSGIAPAAGPQGGGTTVTITGTGYYPGATVTIGGIAATVSSVTPTTLVVTTPGGPNGVASVVVTNLDGNSVTVGTGFTYQGTPPAISVVSPTNGPVAGGGSVTLTGTNFRTGVTVTFGAAAATVTSFSATQLVVTVPAGAGGGTVTVTATNTDATAGSANYTYNPSPTITAINPNNGTPTGGNPVTLTGTGFLSGATVTFGASPAFVTALTATQIVVTSPGGSVGTVTVTVTNPDLQAATTSYTFNATPTITAIAPTNGRQSGGTTVTITGTGFLTGATVTFGASGAAIGSLTATQIICTTPAAASGGPVTVTVTNPDTQAATTSYTYNPPPTISGLNPSSGLTTGGITVTIGGTGFLAGATVTFGAAGATVTLNTPTSLEVTAPISATNGVVTVTVTNTDGQFVTANFTYAYPAPTLSSVAPGSGPETGGTLITLTGTNYQSGATVSVGGAAATSPTFVNAATLTAVTPPGTIGSAIVTAHNPDGQSAPLGAAFTYLPVQTQVLTGQADFGQQHHEMTSATASPGDVALVRTAARFAGNGTVITAVAYDHGSTQRLLVGTESAGAFLTTDGGATWTAFHRHSAPPLPSNRVLSCAIFSNGNAGQTFLIGTDRGAVLTRDGGANFRRYDTASLPALPANGVEAVAFFEGNTLADRFLMACNAGTKLAPGGAVLTTDGGDTFTIFNSVSTPGIQNNHVRGVAYFGGDTTGQRFLLCNYSQNAFGDGGVWLTTNGGGSFTRFSTVSAPPTVSQAARTVAFCNADATGQTWLAGFDTKAGNNGGVEVTTNDGGTFNRLNVAGSELFSDDVSRVAWSGSTLRFVVGTEGGGISYTTNGGTAMTRLSTGSSPPITDGWVAGVDWHQGNTLRFAVGSGTRTATAVAGAVQETVNTAGAFTALPLAAPDVLSHPDVRQVAIFRGDGTGNRLLVATAAGAALSTDGGLTWTRFTTTSSPALPSDDVRGVAWYEGNTTGTHFVIGTASGAVSTSTGGGTFSTFTTAQGLPANAVQAVAYWAGSTAGGGTFLIGTTAGVGYTQNGGTTFTNFSTGSTPAIVSNNVTAVAFYDGGTSNGQQVLIGMGGGTGGLSHSINLAGAPASMSNFTTTLANRDIRSVAFFSNAGNANAWCFGSAGGASVTTSGGGTITNFTTANGLPSNDVRGVATVSAGTLAQRFAAACGGATGGLAFTGNGGTAWTVRNSTSQPALPSDAASSVDYDDSVATYDRWIVGLPATATSTGGCVVERGATYAASGAVTITLVEGGVYPVGGPFLPTWDDRFVRAVDYHDGQTAGAWLLVGGLYGGAVTPNSGTTFSTYTEATTPALLLSVVAGADFCSGDAGGQHFALATPFGVYVSTNGGATFTRYGSAQGLPSDDVRAVSYHDGTTTGQRFAVATGNGIAFTANGGSTWTIRNSASSPAIANDCRAVDWHDGTTTAARLLVGTSSGVFHTSDGGSNFTPRTNGGAGTIASNDVHAVVYDENDGTGASWLVGSWFAGGGAPGGVSSTTNGGGVFTNSLANTIVYAVAAHPGVSGTWLVGHSTGAARTTNSGGAYTPFTRANGLPSNDARAVAFAGGVASAAKWIVGTDEGAVQTVNDGTAFTAFRRGTLSAYLQLNVTETKPPGTTIRYQVLDRFWNVIPDAALPGNSAGLTPDGSGNISLTALNVATYPVVQLRAVLGTTIPGNTPLLREVRIRFVY